MAKKNKWLICKRISKRYPFSILTIGKVYDQVENSFTDKRMLDPQSHVQIVLALIELAREKNTCPIQEAIEFGIKKRERENEVENGTNHRILQVRTLRELKRRAKSIKKVKNIPHHLALDVAAKEIGFSNYGHLIKVLNEKGRTNQ